MVVATPVSLNALVAHLERLDGVAVLALAEQAVADGVAISNVIDALLLPAWEQLDRRANDGELDRATVGAAATIARRALARAAKTVIPPVVAGRAPVMVVSSSTSAALLGADVIGETVKGAGWPPVMLTGPDAPGEVTTRIRACRPAAVVITFADTEDLPAAARVIASAHVEGVPVLAWGQAFGPDRLRVTRLGADGWADSLEAVASTLAAWSESPPVLAASMAVPTGYAELERDRPALLAAAARISGAEGDASDWAQSTAVTVVSHLAAAVLVGDSRVLAEHLHAIRRGLVRNQLLDVHLLGLVDALAGALSESTQPASAYVLAARDELRQALVSSRPRSESESSLVSTPLRAARSLVVATIPTAASSAEPSAPTPSPGGGQVFADILLLAALSCQTPLALVSVPQGPGQWSTLSYGFEHRDGLNDPTLYDFVAGRKDPIEISDLASFPGLSASALASAPHSLRWIYAAPLRAPSGQVLGVVAVLDRWLREVSRREQRAMLAAGRQMVAHLSQLRRVPVPSTTDGRGWAPPSSPDPRTLPGADALGIRRSTSLPEGQQLLRSHEVAVLFDVTERTVINWAAAGKLPSLRTIGGHLRFRSEDVLELLAGRTSGARPATGR